MGSDSGKLESTRGSSRGKPCSVKVCCCLQPGPCAVGGIKVAREGPANTKLPHVVYSPVAVLPNPLPPSPSRINTYEIELKDLSYKIVKRRDTSNFPVLGINVDAVFGRCKPTTHYVLKHVSCTARPGEILAVAGPSGAGKSTLLEVLAGRLRPSSPPSSILVNRQQMETQQFLRISGYVMQHDVLFPMLTVEETLMYSARLRLPASVPMAEKVARVQALMEELGLLHVANSRVGNQTLRGLSGGERRRVSIGVDVIHDPAVLILDEPTSGLDSASAMHVVAMLRNMAVSHGRTIILSIHQPGFRILELLHSILLLAQGTVVHYGSLETLSNRLSASGHFIPEQVNVLEYAIDVIDYLEADCSCQMFPGKADPSVPVKSLQYMFDVESASPLPLGYDAARRLQKVDQVTFANSSSQEILVLAHRFCRNILRTKQLFRARTLHALGAGIGLGSIYFHMGYGTRGYSERYGFLAFSVTLLLSSSIEVLPNFLEECQVLTRETSRGSYRMSSYVLSNTIVFLPFLFLTALLFSGPVYWLVGLAPEISAFLFFCLVIWLLLVTAYTFVAFFSALVPNYQLGYSIIMGLMGSFFLFSGFFISKDDLPKYWVFMHYVSLYKYPLEALLINEYTHVSEKCFGPVLFGGGLCSLTGKDVLVQGGFHEASMKWVNAGIMAGFALLYRILCYVVLRFKLGRRNN